MLNDLYYLVEKKTRKIVGSLILEVKFYFIFSICNKTNY